MDVIRAPFVRVGPLSELRRLGSKVVSSPGGPVLVIANGEDVIALDNRCPHMVSRFIAGVSRTASLSVTGIMPALT